MVSKDSCQFFFWYNVSPLTLSGWNIPVHSASYWNVQLRMWLVTPNSDPHVQIRFLFSEGSSCISLIVNLHTSIFSSFNFVNWQATPWTIVWSTIDNFFVFTKHNTLRFVYSARSIIQGPGHVPDDEYENKIGMQFFWYVMTEMVFFWQAYNPGK